MQWLIDLIIAAAKTEIGYFDRGDPTTFDWELSDLIADNNWHDLNLSAIVPAGARCVLFNVLHHSTSSSGRFMMQTNGNANGNNIASIRTQTAFRYQDFPFLVAPDADRIVEYRIVPPGTNFLRITVRGWWL